MSEYVDGEKTKPGLFGAPRLLSMISGSLKAHSLLIGFVLVYAFAYLVLLRFAPNAAPQDPVGMVVKLTTTILILTAVSLFFQSAYQAFKNGGRKTPVGAIFKVFWQQISSPQKAVPGFTMLGIMIGLSFFYVQVKKLIAVVMPFSWDRYFFELDKTLHFGVSPWEWLDPIFGNNPLLVSVLNFNYIIWFLVMWMTIVYFAFMVKNPLLRTRFFVAFFLAWGIGGGLFALVYSSAGPAFYGRLGLTPDVYAPLMEKLREMNEVYSVWALSLQDQMWLGYSGKGTDVGISAMPSMHNASTMLLIIAGWQLGRRTGFWLSVHGFFIAIGSVYLGWHYAVDIYLGWAITLVAWYVAGFISRWWHLRPHVQAFHNTTIDSPHHQA